MEVVTVLSQNLAGGLLSCFEGSGLGTQCSLKLAYTSFCVTDTSIPVGMLPVTVKNECSWTSAADILSLRSHTKRGQRETLSPPPLPVHGNDAAGSKIGCYRRLVHTGSFSPLLQHGHSTDPFPRQLIGKETSSLPL